MDEDTRSDVNANLMDPIFTVGAFGDSQRIKSFECFIIKLIYYSFCLRVIYEDLVQLI